LDAATGVPLGEQLVELAVGDADHGGGVLAGADAVGEADAAVGRGAAQVGEHLEFELAGELSHAGGEVGAHEFGGIGEVAAILGEWGAVAVAEVGGGAVDGLDAAVVGGVATDQAREVAEFVEDGGEEVVVAIGGGAKGGAEEGFSVHTSEFRVHTSEFSIIPGGAVDEPAEAVGVGVEGEGAGGGETITVEAGDVGFGELASGEIGDLDIEVKWSCPCEEFCPGGDGCILETEVMTAEELLERYAAGERDFAGVDLYPHEGCDWTMLTRQNLQGINLRGAYLYRANFGLSDLSGADLSGAYLKIGALGCAILRGSKMRGTILKQAILRMADLTDSDLTDANLAGARLMEANFTRVNLTAAILTNADLTDVIGDRRFMELNATLFWGTVLPDGVRQIAPEYDLVWDSQKFSKRRVGTAQDFPVSQ
jgi:Pentapeptide repeats (8 copies)